MSAVPTRRRQQGFALLAVAALSAAGLHAGNAFAGARAALSSTRTARSALDKDLVQSSWAEVCPDTSKETLTAVGTVIFDALFETDQSTKDLFSFGDRLNEAEQKKFDKHVAGFTQTVDKAVKGLDDIPTLLPVLNYLGERHAYHDVTKEHYDTAGKTLLAVLEKVLEPKGLWTPETKESWTEVWKVMDSEMRKGQGIA